MQRDVVTVARDTSLKEVAALLVAHGISGLPVCERDGRVAGVVSEADGAYGDADRFDARTRADLVRAFDRSDEETHCELEWRTADGERRLAAASR